MVFYCYSIVVGWLLCGLNLIIYHVYVLNSVLIVDYMFLICRFKDRKDCRSLHLKIIKLKSLKIIEYITNQGNVKYDVNKRFD